MLIVSDTTPLHYLIQIEKIDLLPQLFDEILTPIEVIEELSHPNTPQDVKAWISKSPDWLTVLPSPSDAFSRVTGLDKGETAAIALALDYQAKAILLDDRRGARSAELLGLSVITTFECWSERPFRAWLIFETRSVIWQRPISGCPRRKLSTIFSIESPKTVLMTKTVF